VYWSDHAGIRQTRGIHNRLGCIANLSSWSGSVTNHAPNTNRILIAKLVELNKEDRERLGEVLGCASTTPLFGIIRLRGAAGDSSGHLAYAKTTMIAASPRFNKDDGQPLTSGHKQQNLHAERIPFFLSGFIISRLPGNGTGPPIKQSIEQESKEKEQKSIATLETLEG